MNGNIKSKNQCLVKYVLVTMIIHIDDDVVSGLPDDVHSFNVN